MVGRFSEHLIKSVKRCLKKTLGNSSLTRDELITALAEAEMVINSRLLSVVSSEDLEVPLTCSHLLLSRKILSLLSYSHKEDSNYQVSVQPIYLTRRMKHLDKSLNQFWKRWRLDCLAELRECHRYQKTGQEKNLVSPSVGEVVLVRDLDHLKGLWKLAIVEETLAGRDGHV